jgi:hypothetical protein
MATIAPLRSLPGKSLGKLVWANLVQSAGLRRRAQKVFSPMRLAFLSASRVVDTTKMRDVLGVIPRTPEQGIRDSL